MIPLLLIRIFGPVQSVIVAALTAWISIRMVASTCTEAIRTIPTVLGRFSLFDYLRI